MEVRQANEIAQSRPQQYQAQEQRAQVQLRSAEQHMIADSSGALQNEHLQLQIQNQQILHEESLV
jgi:hypothetical protein